MRLALVGPAHPYKGGPANHVTTLAHRATAAGHPTVIESWSAQYPARLYPGQLTITEPELPLFDPTRRDLSWRRPDGWVRVGRRIAREADAAVLFGYTPVQVPPYLGLLAGVRPRRTGTAAIVIANNVLPHESRAVDRRALTALYSRATGILVHSEAQAELARGLVGVPVAVAALPPHLPPPAPPATAWSGVTRRLLFFGMVRPYKGLDVLLRALAAGPADVSLVVAGEFWGGVEETERLVVELGLGGRVEIRPGYVDMAEIPDLFASVDALVLPYRTATASQNAAVAFDHGTPVVATRAGALAAEVHDGVDGLTAAPDDVADLARAIGALYEPGTVERLRAGVRPVDATPLWAAYLDALGGLVS